METNQVELYEANLSGAFARLEALLAELRGQLSRDQGLPLFVNRLQGSDPDRRRRVIDSLTRIHYQDGQAANEVIHCPALVGVTDQTLALAESINRVKAELHATLKALDKVRVPDPTSGDKVPAVKPILRRLGHARLQRRQATRRIELLESPPESATFTWAHARRKQPLSAAEAREQLLRDLANAGQERQADRVAELAADLAKLDGLHADTPLVRLFAPYQHPRVNLVWTLADGRVIRRQRRAVVPLLYPAGPGDPLPIIRPLPATPGEGPQRIRRRDARVEETALLPSVGIHRVIGEPA